MKRTSALRPILFPGSSPTCRSLAPMCLGDIYYVYHSRGRGGIVKEGLIKCFDRKQGKCPPPPPQNANFAKGYSPIWPQPLCATEQGMVFRVLGLEQVRYTISLFSLLYKVPFWTASFKMCEFWHIDIMGDSDNSPWQWWAFELLIVWRTPCTVKCRV